MPVSRNIGVCGCVCGRERVARWSPLCRMKWAAPFSRPLHRAFIPDCQLHYLFAFKLSHFIPSYHSETWRQFHEDIDGLNSFRYVDVFHFRLSPQSQMTWSRMSYFDVAISWVCFLLAGVRRLFWYALIRICHVCLEIYDVFKWILTTFADTLKSIYHDQQNFPVGWFVLSISSANLSGNQFLEKLSTKEMLQLPHLSKPEQGFLSIYSWNILEKENYWAVNGYVKVIKIFYSVTVF